MKQDTWSQQGKQSALTDIYTGITVHVLFIKNRKSG